MESNCLTVIKLDYNKEESVCAWIVHVRESICSNGNGNDSNVNAIECFSDVGGTV